MNTSGLGNYSRSIIGNLCRFSPHRLILYTPKINNDLSWPNDLKDLPLKTLTSPIKMSPFHQLWRSTLSAKAIKKERLDIFHGLSNELPCYPHNQLKSIVTIHDLIVLKFPHYFSKINQRILNYKLQKAIDVADVIIAISDRTKKDIINYFPHAKNKTITHYQSFLKQYEKEATLAEMETVKAKYNLPSSFFLFVGTVEERKNPLLILKALKHKAQYWNIPLFIIGRERSYSKKLKEYIGHHKLGKFVHFLGSIDTSELKSFYALASVFIFPSSYEGHGLPVTESLTQKTPVITTKNTCLEESAGPGALYIQDNNLEELIDAIDKILSNSKLKNDLVEKGYQWVQKYSPNESYLALNNIYQRLIN